MDFTIFRTVLEADEYAAVINAFNKSNRAREVFDPSAPVVVERIKRGNENQRYFYVAEKLTEKICGKTESIRAVRENYSVVHVRIHSADTVSHNFQVRRLHIFAENIQRAQLVEMYCVPEAFAVFFDK